MKTRSTIAPKVEPAKLLEQMRQRYRGEFRPFIVRTADGREFKAPQWGYVAIGKDMIVALDRFGETVWVKAADIASVKDLPKRRRRKRAA